MRKNRRLASAVPLTRPPHLPTRIRTVGTEVISATVSVSFPDARIQDCMGHPLAADDMSGTGGNCRSIPKWDPSLMSAVETRVGWRRHAVSPFHEKSLRSFPMKKHAIVLGLLTVMGFASEAFARDRRCCCNPVAAAIQTQCCQKTLLPYHVALKRADDAAHAEVALSQVTDERNGLQSELARLQAELKAAVAERDKANYERAVAAAERDQARRDALASAKTAAEQQAQAIAAKQAAEAATKAKQEANAAVLQAREVFAKLKDELTQQVAAVQAEVKNAAAERDNAVAELTKSRDEVAQLQQKLVAALTPTKRTEDENPDEATTGDQDDADSTTDDANRNENLETENAEIQSAE